MHTGEITIYPSLNEMSRKIGVSPATALWQLKKRMFPSPVKGYCFKYVDDDSDWPSYTEDELERLKHVTAISKPVKLTNSKDGKEIKFHSARLAAEYLKVTSGYIHVAARDNLDVKGFKVEKC